ncbi:DUF4132 domain-containing protein [Streptomyces europaeiscabiei]|uniref:DUF4132 domain-containing protein n=1 Tax=Streptomyces europaeiscabiei TaxID=146819 RepID=UPI0029B35804|nr:DUF4132 domain-containing protein [Streptomyces europaeiscabiei]MDX3696427.1 DUF4132 domain-containing protein [Streptomyces europaeiscabiei]
MAERVDDLLEHGNGWAERIRDRVIHLPPELTALVLHLGQAGTFWDWHYKVDAAWKRQTKALLKTDGARELVTEAVRALAADSSLHGCTDPNVTWQDLGAKSDRTPTRDLANGFALAAGYLTRGASPAELEDLVADLLTVARKNAHVLDGYYKRDDDLSGAVFTALADLSAMEALWTLHREVQPGAHSHRHLAKMVKKTATRIGVPPHQLQERTVLTHGVQADGTLRLGWIGRGAVWLNIPYEALIAISDTGRVTVDWTDVDEGGTVTRTTTPFRSPTGFKTKYLPHNVDVTRRLARTIEDTLSAERQRLYALREENRLWPYAEWAHYYRDHPLTGIVARALIWEYEMGPGSWTAGLPHPAGCLTLDGRTHAVTGTARVRLWNPTRATPAQVTEVRAFLAAREVHQPYGQTSHAT